MLGRCERIFGAEGFDGSVVGVVGVSERVFSQERFV